MSYKFGPLKVIGHFSHDGIGWIETDGSKLTNDDKLYTSLSANTIMAKIGHFQVTFCLCQNGSLCEKSVDDFARAANDESFRAGYKSMSIPFVLPRNIE